MSQRNKHNIAVVDRDTYRLASGFGRNIAPLYIQRHAQLHSASKHPSNYQVIQVFPYYARMELFNGKLDALYVLT
jgi:hypothetical protein